MKLKYAPLMASLLCLGSSIAPSFGQGLPNTNMGRFVHQPGDNQYQQGAQLERHGTTYADRTGPGSSVVFNRGGGGGGIPFIGASGSSINPMTLMGSTAPSVDISVEPIAADEPVPAPGFPPMPERLQLPGGDAPGSSWNGSAGGGGGGHGGGGGSRGGGPSVQGVHEHYVHVAPGSYQNSGGGGDSGGGAQSSSSSAEAVPGASSPIGGANPDAAPVNPGGHRGYYKVGNPPPIMIHKNMNSDVYMSGGNSQGAPQYSGSSSKDLKALGSAPKLDDSQDAAGAPEAPQAATVSQSTTQDLSLPDDEFSSRYGLRDSTGKRAARYMGRQIGRTTNRVINRATGMIGF